MKPIRVWMVSGPAGGVAPYYGFAFTRKDLVKNCDKIIPATHRLVRVWVCMERPK